MKGVAVLGSSEGVSGTIFFSQEGDGNLVIDFICMAYVNFFCLLLSPTMLQVQPL